MEIVNETKSVGTADVLADVLKEHGGQVYNNLPAARLVEASIVRGEGKLAASGALRVLTGKYTGRSPEDKFVVATPDNQEAIWWHNNKSVTPEIFEKLYRKVIAYLKDKDIFVFDGCVGADTKHAMPVRVVNEYAWHNLFVRQLFIRKTPESQSAFPRFTILSAPGCAGDPAVDGTNSEAFVMIHLERRIILIGGTQYAGEMKKGIFSVMNYLYPRQGILSMHCSANQGENGDVALFFGLSGTGKTTLSADPDRFLIGDDEHAWNSEGVFNIEGGCYAKCIHLNRENEPQIWEAIRFGSVLENVSMCETTREVNYDDDSLTENTRAAYPLPYIPSSVEPSVGGHPSTIIFLTADAFGVLPPIAKLEPDQAMYYFLSGYTSKLAGTERGIVAPQATFSACFGSPFLPLSPIVYADLLKAKLLQHNTRVFLINTGWQGGAYGTGKRVSIQHTRRMVSAAINGHLDQVNYIMHPVFNLQMPAVCPGVPDTILQPQNSWDDKAAYLTAANQLAAMFHKNFEKYSDIPANVKMAGPFSAAPALV